jgi:hypothetical protein
MFNLVDISNRSSKDGVESEDSSIMLVVVVVVVQQSGRKGNRAIP